MSGCSTTAHDGCDRNANATMPTNSTLHDKGYGLLLQNSQSQAVIYVVVILVLYFSILFVLICRYMRKERNQFQMPYIRSSILKKDRYSRCARDLESSHMSTVSTQMMMDKEPVASQPTSALLPSMAQMDTAV